MQNHIFEDLFVLELANNHWGKVERGLRIIADFSHVIRVNNVRAAIKLQLRDVDSFVHKSFAERDDIRYIKKTVDTKLTRDDFITMVRQIKQSGCIPMATPFDEASVEFSEFLDLPILKIASSDLNDWPLIERIARTRRPVIVSTGGSSLKDVDDLVLYFRNRNIPLALNHCVSLYPSEDNELEMNQIDFLRNRYPDNVIGFSTHEYHDWTSSMLISYAKGARSWERHIDIEMDEVPVSPYCSLPHQIDTWFKTYHKAREMCGSAGLQKRIPPAREVEYLDKLVRGIYAKGELPAGYVITKEGLERDFYMSIPLQKGQLSVREVISGLKLTKALKADQALMIDDVDSPYASSPQLMRQIYQRGI